MLRILSIFLLLIIPLFSEALPVVVSGSAPEFAGRQLFVYAYDDKLSDTPVEVGSAFINEEGLFSCTFDLTASRELMLRITWVSFRMYAQPEATYQIRLKAQDSGQVMAFHRSARLDVEFEDLPSSDINYKISRFNEGYDRFYSENYLELAHKVIPKNNPYKRKNEGKLSELIVGKDTTQVDQDDSGKFDEALEKYLDHWREQAVSEQDGFVSNYYEFSLAYMELSLGTSRKELYDRYLTIESAPIQIEAFTTFANAFYGGLATDLLQHGAQKAKLRDALKNGSAVELSEVVLGSGVCEGSIEMVLMASTMFATSYLGKYDVAQKDAERMLEILGKGSVGLPAYPPALAIYQDLKGMSKGSEFPKLNLLNSSGDRVDLSELPEKHLYIVATASWCTTCQQELQLLEKVSKKYTRDIQVVVLSLDDDFDDFKAMIGRYNRNSWKFYYAMSDPMVREKLNLWSLPGFFTLDPLGRIYFEHTLAPSQMVEKQFHQIDRELHPSQKIKVWDD